MNQSPHKLLNDLIISKNISKKKLAESIGVDYGNLWKRLNNPDYDWRINDFNKIITALGMEMEININNKEINPNDKNGKN